MKKLLAFVLSAALMLPLAACGGGSNHSDTSAATIKTNEGDTVTMTAEELIDAYDSNEASSISYINMRKSSSLVQSAISK